MAVYQRFYQTVRDNQGNVVNGASCAVYDVSTGALATIYDPASDDASPVGISNPVVTGPGGVFGFMAADGVYDVKITGGNIAQARLRLALNGANINVYADLASVAAGKGQSLVAPAPVTTSFGVDGSITENNGTWQKVVTFPSPGLMVSSMSGDIVGTITTTFNPDGSISEA